ncbi:MAG: hypothetical protein L6U16_14210 [Porphyromonadaceae bacterium]|nr:MAG: hypothetical protein L6U16_14210 [Porphyromonadaceae bacterium]
MRRSLVIFVMLFSLLFGGYASAQLLQWREIQHKVQGRSLVDPAQTDGVEIFGKDGTITIRTQRKKLRLKCLLFSVSLFRKPH